MSLAWSATPALTSYYTRAVTTSAAASGTTRSLYQYKNSSTGHDDGLTRSFSGLKPASISWWARVTQTGKSAAYFKIYSSSSASSYLIFHYFSSTGYIRMNQPNGTPIEVPYVHSQWHHMELRNIDWTAGTYDYYVDGMLRKSGAQLYGTTSGGIYRLDLYNFDYPSYGYWDEIEFR